jgi:LPXTG-motif cell wall-anchored protein
LNPVLAASHQILAPDHIVILALVLVGGAVYALVRRKKKGPK